MLAGVSAAECLNREERSSVNFAVIDELAKFMDQPLTAIVETITGALAAGPQAWMVMTGRIVQGILEAKLFQQLSLEIKELRAKGKIPDDFADEKKYKYGNVVTHRTRRMVLPVLQVGTFRPAR